METQEYLETATTVAPELPEASTYQEISLDLDECFIIEGPKWHKPQKNTYTVSLSDNS